MKILWIIFSKGWWDDDVELFLSLKLGRSPLLCHCCVSIAEKSFSPEHLSIWQNNWHLRLAAKVQQVGKVNKTPWKMCPCTSIWKSCVVFIFNVILYSSVSVAGYMILWRTPVLVLEDKYRIFRNGKSSYGKVGLVQFVSGSIGVVKQKLYDNVFLDSGEKLLVLCMLKLKLVCVAFQLLEYEVVRKGGQIWLVLTKA